MASWVNKGRLLARMAAIPPAVKKAVKAQTKTNAEDMVSQVKRNMQTFEHPTGELESSLTIVDSSNQYSIGYTIIEADGEGRYVEFGHGNAQPKPHFYPAYRVNKRKYRTRTNKAAKSSYVNWIGK